MSNLKTIGKIYIDTAGAVFDTPNQIIKISQFLFTSSSAGDSVVLKESSSGSTVLVIKNGVANDTKHIDCSTKPVPFNGLYVQSISAGATLVCTLTNAGE